MTNVVTQTHPNRLARQAGDILKGSRPMLDSSFSPAHKRGQSLRKLFERAFALRRDDLAALGGNLRVWIPNVATWTIVTAGSMAGVQDDPGKVIEAKFALRCDDTIVLQVLTGQLSEQAVIDAVKKKLLSFEGDVDLFVRFAELLP